MPRIPILQKRVTSNIGGGERYQVTPPTTNIESNVLGNVGNVLSDIATKGMELEAKKEAKAEKIRIEAEKLIAKQQMERDKTFAMKAYNEFLLIASDHDNELYRRKGFDARGISNDMATMMKPEFKRIKGNLENPNQITLFEALAVSYAISRKNKANKYERDQVAIASKNESQSIIVNSTNFAIDNYEDNNAVKKALQDINMFSEYALPGAGAEEIKAYKDKAKSELYIGRVNAYLANDDVDGANAYYNAVQDDILPDERLRLKGNLIRNDTLQKAQKLVDAVASEFLDEKERLNQVRELAEPGEERKEAMRIMKARIADDKRLDDEQHDIFISAKIREIRSASTLQKAFKIASSAQRDKDKTMLEDIAQKFFDAKIKKPEKIVTDPRVLNDLRTAISQGTIREVDDIYKFVAGKPITTNDITESIDFLNQRGTVGDIKYSTVKTIYKDKTGNLAEAEPEEFANIYKYVESSIKASGKTPTPAELYKLISNAVVEGEIIKNGGFLVADPNKTFIEAYTSGELDGWLPDVKSEEKDIIKREIKDANKRLPKNEQIPINETEIRSWKKYNPKWMGIKVR